MAIAHIRRLCYLFERFHGACADSINLGSATTEPVPSGAICSVREMGKVTPFHSQWSLKRLRHADITCVRGETYGQEKNRTIGSSQ